MSKRKKQHDNTAGVLHFMQATKADSLTGFIAGFLVGVIGMYVYAVIITNLS
jgi:hypothetical protein